MGQPDNADEVETWFRNELPAKPKELVIHLETDDPYSMFEGIARGMGWRFVDATPTGDEEEGEPEDEDEPDEDDEPDEREED